MSILGGAISRLVTDNERGAGVLLVNAGRSAIIGAIGGGPLGYAAGSLLDLLMRSAAGETQSIAAREALKEKTGSAAQKRRNKKKHEQWLADNAWRFDWRSQPRRPAGSDEGGEWMPGRLDHPVQVKYPVSRRIRQQRTRAIKAYKARRAALGKTSTRTIHTSWGDF